MIRWEKAFNHVKTHDATNWVTGFLGELKAGLHRATTRSTYSDTQIEYRHI